MSITVGIVEDDPTLKAAFEQPVNGEQDMIGDRARGAEVCEGGAPMSGAIARKVIQFFRHNQAAPEVDELTEREHAVLVALSEGQQYKEISDSLEISINTVRKHIRCIYEKLHVNTRADAVRKLGRV